MSAGRIVAVAMGVAVAAMAFATSQFDRKILKQMEQQWKKDPVACLEALRELAANNQARAIAKLEQRLGPRERELYEAGLNQAGDSPETFWTMLMLPGTSCDVKEVNGYLEKQLTDHPESIRQFLAEKRKAQSRPTALEETRMRARKFFELAWPVRSNAHTVDAYMQCGQDTIKNYLNSLF